MWLLRVIILPYTNMSVIEEVSKACDNAIIKVGQEGCKPSY